MTRDEVVKLYDAIDFEFEVSKDEVEKFTPEHEVYDITFSLLGADMPIKDKYFEDLDDMECVGYSFHYQCNPRFSTPNKFDCLGAVVSDAMAYCDYKELYDFLYEFGYTESPQSIKKGIDAHRECRQTYNRLKRFFSKDGLLGLYDYLNE